LGIIGIDFDHCIQDGELNPEIEPLLSKTGLTSD
jgi:hypothetical protein